MDLKLLEQRGIRITPEFLPPETVQRIIEDVNGARTVPATVATRSGVSVVEERTRRTLYADVSPSTQEVVHARLTAVMPIIGEYYDVQLAGCESPYFLVYSKGDFFKPHQDRSHGEGYSDRVQMRKISAVIFLNSERRELSMEDYCGGKLVFYDLGRGVSPETRRLPVTGEAGLLVTFPSDTLHEVTPVSHGQRYTIASFFY